MSAIKLDKLILKNILLLNNNIPEANAKYWVTVDEMRERLVGCGVDKVLTVDIIADALKWANRGGCLLTNRKDGRTNYYRPACYSHEAGAPSDQRINLAGSKRVPISPDRNFYKTKKDTSEMLDMVNRALVTFDNECEVQHKQQRIQLRLKKLMHL